MLGDGNIDKAKEPRVLRRLPRADEFAWHNRMTFGSFL